MAESWPSLSRRSLLGGLAAGIATPALATSPTSTIRYLPRFDPNILDPHWTTSSGTRNHAYIVYDTLYGLDLKQEPHPQMAAGHVVEDGGRTWTITLREGLRWHDGEPVLAKDCVASLQRWARRDGAGQSLLAVTEEMAALDDRRLRIRLKEPWPFLLYTLGKSAGAAPLMMPARIAEASPNRPVTEIIGSGPFRFVQSEYQGGNRLVYEKFAGYVPRADGPASGTAGPKVARVDRIEKHIIPDVATALSALRTDAADWIELVPVDLLRLVSNDRRLTVRVLDPDGFIGVFRLNHLQPPFDNPAIRRAALAAVDQAELMQALVGDDARLKSTPVGFFAPGLPMASTRGLDQLGAPRDPARVKRDLEAAGYHGEKVVLLAAVDLPGYIPICETLADQLRKAGFTVDYQAIDWPTLLRRRASREPVEKGGWSGFVTLGFYAAEVFSDPFTNVALRANGLAAWNGWPSSERLEALRESWMRSTDMAERRRIAEAMQVQALEDVPYVPMGQFRQYTAYSRKLDGIREGFPVYWGVSKAS